MGYRGYWPVRVSRKGGIPSHRHAVLLIAALLAGGLVVPGSPVSASMPVAASSPLAASDPPLVPTPFSGEPPPVVLDDEALDDLVIPETISIGNGYGCGLRPDRTITCWGAQSLLGTQLVPAGQFRSVNSTNGNCAIGMDRSLTCWDAIASPPAGPALAVATGSFNACVLRPDATVECWGNALMDSWTLHTAEQTVAVPPRGVGETTVTIPGQFMSVVAPVRHFWFCGVRVDLTLACWGSSGPRTPPAGQFLQVSVGGSFGCGLRLDTTLACWGSGGWHAPPVGTFRMVASGAYHWCALTTTGQVVCQVQPGFNPAMGQPPAGSFEWVGSNIDGSCGARVDGTLECWGHHLPPPDGPYVGVANNGYTVCLARADGSQRCNDSGLADLDDDPVGFVQTSMGGTTCGIRPGGSLECIGTSLYGFDNVPAGVFTAVDVTSYHACAVRADGELRCWGHEEMGAAWEVVIVDPEDPQSPLEYVMQPPGTFIDVAVGYRAHAAGFSCALRTDQTVLCWGASPDVVDNAPDGEFVSITAGDRHACALDALGEATCWGQNISGSTSPPPGPFEKVVAGADLTCAIRSGTGELACVGGNTFQHKPPDGGSFIDVAPEWNSTCAVRTDGVYQCWGALRVEGDPPELVVPDPPNGTIDVFDLEVVDPTVASGFAVQLGDIPVERLVEAAEAIAGTPLRAVDVRSTPLRAIPLGAIPLRAIPLRAIGGAETTVLSDAPLEGGWERLLVGTPLEGIPLQTITVDDALAVIDEADLVGLTLSGLDLSRTAFGNVTTAALLAGGPDGAAGLAATPLEAIPLRAIPLGAIPLRAIPLGAIPLGAIDLDDPVAVGALSDLAVAPLGSIPLGAIPLRAIPLGAIDLTVSPLGAIPLRAIPLGAIPLRAIDVGGGEFCADVHDPDPLSGGTCADLGIDPDTVTVLEYLGLLGAGSVEATPLRAIPLGAIPLGAIPLGAIDVAGVPLGAIDLDATNLAVSPLGAIPLRAIANCDALLDTPTCDAFSVAGYLDSLGPGATLEATPLGAIDLASLPLRAIPLRAIPLRAIDVAGVPLASIPLRAIEIDSSPLGAIELAGVPLRAIPLADLDDMSVDDLVDTIEAAAPGSPEYDVTLGDLLDHLSVAFFSELAGMSQVAAGTLLVTLLLAADIPWETLDLAGIETRDVSCGVYDLDLFACPGSAAPDDVRFHATFEADPLPVSGMRLDLFAPQSMAPVPGSVVLHLDGVVDPVPLAEPRWNGSYWTLRLPRLPVGTHRVEVSHFAPYDIGARTVAGRLRVGFASLLSPQLPLTVEAAPSAGTREAPLVIEPDVLHVGHIDTPGRQDWFEVPAPGPGYRVAVYLSGMSGDIDTFVYRPETAPPLSGADTVRAIPLGQIPLLDPGVDPTGAGPLPPEVLADSPVDTDLTLAAASTNRGTEAEEVVFFSRPGEERYVIQVAGYNRATSVTPYVLRVKYEPIVDPRVLGDEPCPARPVSLGPLLAGAPPVVPAETTTLFLTNPQRLSAIYGAGGQAVIDVALADLLAAEVDEQPLVRGVVVDIASLPGVADAFAGWDARPCDPDRANVVAGLVQRWIQQTVEDRPSVRHVAILGSDEVVPFVRLADSTVVANEATYTADFDPGSALFGALATRHYLSDTPYGDLDPIPWMDRYAYLPELGVGRLVEMPEHIEGAIRTFIEEDGVLDPSTAAVAGYDFLTDGAEAVKAALAGIVDHGTGEPVIVDVDPDGDLLAPDWSRQDLRDLAYDRSGVTPDVISPNAHFDHYRSLPAVGDLTKSEDDLFTIADIDDLIDDRLENRIVFTMGCHAGLNVPSGSALDPDRDADWAEVYGAARAIYVGNTGYGYGDTAAVALTESLMAWFAYYLDGDRTVGHALAQAKQEQFGKAGLYGVYDLKAIEQATLYGLPMWRIDGPGRDPGLPTLPPLVTEPVTGLEVSEFEHEPVLEEQTGDLGSYWTADGGSLVVHWRPVQPATSLEVTRPDRVATGVLLTDLESTDIVVDDPAFSRPTAASATLRQPEIETLDTVFPASLANLSTTSYVPPSGLADPLDVQQRVNLIAGQYLGTGPEPVQRLFSVMSGLVHYASDPNDVDWTAPSIDSVDAEDFDGWSVFTVETNDPESGVSRVVVLYRASATGGVSTWQSIDLAIQPDGVTWTGSGHYGPGVIAPLEYIVQAVNGDGVVGLSSSKGEYHQSITGDVPPFLPPHGFADVIPGSFYDTPAAWLKYHQITTGFGNETTYAPDVEVTRAQMAAFLWRMMGSPAVHPDDWHTFDDVPNDAFYDEAVAWLLLNAVTTGWGDANIFAPEVVVSRAQMAAFLHRLAGEPQINAGNWHTFDDVPKDEFYDEAVAWLLLHEITTGWGDANIFAPAAPVTRAQMAAFLHRLASAPAAWDVPLPPSAALV